MGENDHWEDDFFPPLEITEERTRPKNHEEPLEKVYLHILAVFMIFTISSTFFGLFLPKEEVITVHSYNDGEFLVNTEEKSILITSSDIVLTYYPYQSGYTFYYELEDGTKDKMLAYWEMGGPFKLISLHNEMPREFPYYDMVVFLKGIPEIEKEKPSKMSELSHYTWFRLFAISMICVLAPQLYWFFWAMIPSRGKAYNSDFHLFKGYEDGYHGAKIRKMGKFYLAGSGIFFLVEWFAGESVWPFW